MTEIILLEKSFHRTPLSIIVFSDLTTSGKNGKLLAVDGLTESQNQSTMATKNDISSQPQFGIAATMSFFFLFSEFPKDICKSPFFVIFSNTHLYFMCIL